MKLRNLLVILLAFCLAGCSWALPETTAPRTEDAIATAPTGQPAAAPTTTPTEPSTVPPETQSPATQPTQGETLPPQVIVLPEPEDGDFVLVKAYIPDIFVDLRYATANNFTNQEIYEFTDAWLRYGTVKKLISVQEALKQQGLYLKIWDGFRPVSAQFKLWEVYPDPTYVANPNNGFSSHSRGNTVDITLVYADGTELVMPTEFDVFSRLADRDYSDCSPETAENALLLEELMIMHGFKPYSGEWWHFSDSQSYPVEEVFEPVTAAAYYADCQEYISLRAKPSSTSDMVTRIPAGAQFQIRAKYGDFALVSYNDLWGYVLREYIQPVYQNDTPQM